MNIRRPIAALLLSLGSLQAEASAEWRITGTPLVGRDQEMLEVDSSVTIQLDAESVLSISVWGDHILAEIEVFDENGAKLRDVITTGPAPAFSEEVSFRKGQKRSFKIFPRFFLPTHSGTYSARGKIGFEASGGKEGVLELRKISFHIEVPKKDPK